MEKNNLDLIRNDLKYKRDCLHLAHENLKQEGDFYQKIIIFTSLASGIFESIKMKLELTDPALELLPIILTSFVCGISSYVKFKQYAERQEVLIQSTTILTNTLNQVRNADELTEEITTAYNHSLELLEMSLYPDVRKKYLKLSQRNMESIIKNENRYFDNIDKVRNGIEMSKYDSDTSEVDSDISKDNTCEVDTTENILMTTLPQAEKKVLEKIDENDEYNNL